MDAFRNGGVEQFGLSQEALLGETVPAIRQCCEKQKTGNERDDNEQHSNA